MLILKGIKITPKEIDLMLIIFGLYNIQSLGGLYRPEQRLNSIKEQIPFGKQTETLLIRCVSLFFRLQIKSSHILNPQRQCHVRKP